MSLFKFKKEAFGLDISENHIRVARLKKDGDDYALASWGQKEIAPGIVVDGELKNPEELTKALKEIPKFTKGEEIKTPYVTFALPEEETFLRIIKLPKMTADKAKKAAIFEAENHIPIPVSELYIDCEAFNYDEGDFTEALITATPRKIVDAYAKAIEDAGYIPAIFETENQAVSRAILKQGKKGTVLIIDIGQTRTNFSVLTNGKLKFGSIISESLDDFDLAIKDSLKVDLKTAKELKYKYGLLNEKGAGNGVYKAINPILISMIRKVQKYTDFYASKKEEFENFKIDKALLCGEGAALSGIENDFNKNLEFQCDIANPWVNVVSKESRQVPTMQYNESLGFGTVIGLALRGLKMSDEKYD